MNPNDYYIKDEDELIFTGKKIREYRDICRKEGYKQAIEDVINHLFTKIQGEIKK